MKQLACGAPPLQLQAGTSGGPSSRAPLTAAPLLAPGQWRRSERSVAGHARRPAAVGSGGSSSGGAAPHKLLTAEPHQQHAQPPRLGAQQQRPEPAASQQRPPSPPQRLPPQQRIRAAAAEQPGPSSSGAPSSSGSPSGAAPTTPAAVAAGEGSTQLIFRFERRGDGWGEEILPHLVVEQRPLEKKKKRAYSRPDPWKVRPGLLGTFQRWSNVPGTRRRAAAPPLLHVARALCPLPAAASCFSVHCSGRNPAPAHSAYCWAAFLSSPVPEPSPDSRGPSAVPCSNRSFLFHCLFAAPVSVTALRSRIAGRRTARHGARCDTRPTFRPLTKLSWTPLLPCVSRLQEGSLECYLVDLGVPPDDVDRVVTQVGAAHDVDCAATLGAARQWAAPPLPPARRVACRPLPPCESHPPPAAPRAPQAVAWRVTPGGRSLIDRRRRSRVERNVRLVVEHLELECGVPFGELEWGVLFGERARLPCCPAMLCGWRGGGRARQLDARRPAGEAPWAEGGGGCRAVRRVVRARARALL